MQSSSLLSKRSDVLSIIFAKLYFIKEKKIAAKKENHHIYNVYNVYTMKRTMYIGTADFYDTISEVEFLDCLKCVAVLRYFVEYFIITEFAYTAKTKGERF